MFPATNDVHDGGLDVETLGPLGKVADFLLDDGFGLAGLVASSGEIFLHHFLEVVDIVQIDVVKAVDVGVNVPGNGDIYEEHGAVLADLEHGTDITGTDDGLGRAGRSDDDIHIFQVLGQRLEGDGPPVELGGQFLPARQGAVGHDDFPDARLKQMSGGQLGHFSGAHQHGAVLVHVAENALGQLHGRIADGNGAGGNGGFCAHALGYGKGLVQQAVENDAHAVGGNGLAIGSLELAENLGFAQHHGVEAGGYGEQMAHGVEILVNIDIVAQFIHIRATGGGPAVQKLPGRVSRAGGQQFHAVAGGKNQGLIDVAFTGHGPGIGGAEIHKGESFPHIHAGCAVIEAHKNDIAIHITAE